MTTLQIGHAVVVEEVEGALETAAVSDPTDTRLKSCVLHRQRQQQQRLQHPPPLPTPPTPLSGPSGHSSPTSSGTLKPQRSPTGHNATIHRHSSFPVPKQRTMSPVAFPGSLNSSPPSAVSGRGLNSSPPSLQLPPPAAVPGLDLVDSEDLAVER